MAQIKMASRLRVLVSFQQSHSLSVQFPEAAPSINNLIGSSHPSVILPLSLRYAVAEQRSLDKIGVLLFLSARAHKHIHTYLYIYIYTH